MKTSFLCTEHYFLTETNLGIGVGSRTENCTNSLASSVGTIIRFLYKKKNIQHGDEHTFQKPDQLKAQSLVGADYSE
jgi:hypothetical protein